MSSLANLREQLQKFKIQRAAERSNLGSTADQGQDTTGNTTDHRSWLKRIEQQGNTAEDWLLYTNFLTQNVQHECDVTNFDYICNSYSKAIRVISSNGGHKCESYVRLFVNYANFVSQRDVEDARDLFYQARTNLRNYAIVHIFGAQFELKQGNRDRCRKIFQKAKDMDTEPAGMLDKAHMNFLLGHNQFVTEELMAKYAASPADDHTDSKQPTLEISRDYGISNAPRQSSNVANLSDRDLKPVLSNQAFGKTGFAASISSSSDDSPPLAASRSAFGFSKPGVPAAPGTASKRETSFLIKPPPVKRDLSSVSSECEMSSPPHGPPHHRFSIMNNAFLPSDHSEEEGTVSFNGVKKRLALEGVSTDHDTVPLSFDSSNGQYHRSLRTSHSTPNCRNTSSMSVLSSRKKRRDLGSTSNKGEIASKHLVPTNHRFSIMNNAFLPDEHSEEEGTVSFVRKRVVCGDACEERDTVPLSFDSSIGQYNRPLHASHSPPDCNNPSSLSMLSSRKKRVMGRARRVLPQVSEGDKLQTPHKKFGLPLMPSLDNSHSQGFVSSSLLLKTSGLGSCSNTLTGSQQSILVETPSQDCRLPKPDVPVSSCKLVKGSGTDTLAGDEPQSPVLQSRSSQQAQQVKSPPRVPRLHEPGESGRKPPGELPVPPVALQPAVPSTQPTPSPVKAPVKHDQLVINRKIYTVLNCIGQGGTSSVFAVIDPGNSIRAVKIVNMTGADESTVRSYRNEIELLQGLQSSDRVIRMFDYEFCTEKSILYVVMEKGDTDLASFFSKKKFDDIKIMYFWQEMLESVQVLHAKAIVHTDLKPANFMLVAGHLKLIDFGIAKTIQQDMTSVTTDQQVGTLNFMSPEALMADSYGSEEDENGEVQRKHKIGYKSDVWSLGCILYRMVYGRTPFQSIRHQLEKMRAIVDPKYEVKFPDIPNALLRDTLQKCLIRDPHLRPSIDELLDHPYLRKIKEAEPAIPMAGTHEAMLKLMRQVASDNFSSMQKTVQGFLAQLQQDGADPAQDAGSAKGSSGRRIPLAPIKIHNKD